jgi:hypothetical protein
VGQSRDRLPDRLRYRSWGLFALAVVTAFGIWFAVPSQSPGWNPITDLFDGESCVEMAWEPTFGEPSTPVCGRIRADGGAAGITDLWDRPDSTMSVQVCYVLLW